MKPLLSVLLKTFFVICLFANEVSAKALYMTVRRDYAPTDSAAIELNYYSTGPIQLRVLAPKDLKGFIASQIDLRRAWRAPRVHFNPMHFLAEGMNASRFDTDWIRSGTDWRMRKAVPELGGAVNAQGSSPIPPGPEKIISSPDAFTLVTEQIIVPESEDSSKPFDVPGFDSWFGSRGSLKTKIIELPKLAPGFYVVQTIQGDDEGQVVVVVNDIQAQLQQTSGRGIYHVADRTGAPTSGASVSVRNLQGKWLASGKTNASGLFVSQVKDTDLVTLVETPKGGTAIIDSEFFATSAVFPDLYLYTDRPMYRKGNGVHFRGILRERQAGVSRLAKVLPGTKVKVELVSTEGKPGASSVEVTVTPFGTFSGEFKLKEDEGEGVYRVVAAVAGKSHIGELRVRDYVKPVFFVTVKSDQETASAGDEIRARIKAERYAGGVPTGARAKAQLYRVKMETPQWVEDAGLGETGSTVTYGFDRGQSESTSLPILIEEKDSIELNDRAEGEVSFKLPTELPGAPGFDYKFVLKVTVIDADEHYATGSVSFLDLNSEVTAQARFNKVLAVDAQELKLAIRSVAPSGSKFPSASGSVEFTLTPYGGSPRKLSSQDIRTDENGHLSLKPPTTGNGELRAVVILKDKRGRPARAETSVIVASEPPEKGVMAVPELRLISEESVVSAGQTVRLLALLPDRWGVGGRSIGQLYVTVASRGIHENRVVPVDGLGKWIEQKIDAKYGSSVTLIVSYPDSVNGWTERRASFRIMDPTRALRVQVKPLAEEAAPGGKQSVRLVVTDGGGKPVRAELSLAVVDRAVLDLQPEIRPSLLEFFYPTDRLNLMVFLSSQFQSYGYAEKVARLFKPNYWFAATKSPTEVLDQKDTAFWSGRLVTNERGEATATFQLPGNQTIWRAIAVAADTNGRFGEAQSEFKANMPVNTILGFPQFIRRGDEASLRASVTAQKIAQPIAVEYSLLAPAGITLSTPLSVKQKMNPGEHVSKSTKLSVAADVEPKTVKFIGRLKVGNSDLSFGNSMKITSDLTDQPRSFEPADGKIKVALEPGAVMRSAVLRVSSGLYGSLLPAMRWLIRYPYGCVEQLTSSTVPNLVFAGILEKAGADLSKEEMNLLAQAIDHGKSGVSRLKSYLKKDNSLGWFNSENSGDANMTLLVLTILAGVEDKKISQISSFHSTFDYLKQQGFVPASSQGIALTYVDSVLRRGYYSGMRYDTQLVPELKAQSEWALSSAGTITDRARLLLAIGNYKTKDSGVEAERVKLIASLKNFNEFRSRPQQNSSWSAYPGRYASTVSLVGRALHENAKPGDLPEDFTKTIRREILKNFDGESFGSTFETANVLIHSQWLINEELKAYRSMQAHDGLFRLNGKTLEGKRVNTLGGFDLVLEPKKLGSGAEIAVNAPKAGVIRLLAQVGAPLSQTKPISQGWTIGRQYFKLGAGGARAPLDPAKERVAVGDLVYVQVSFERDVKNTPFWASRYYVLTEQIPAGFQIIEEDNAYVAAPYSLPLRGGYRVREINADQMRWYFDFTRGWMERTTQTGFVMRANYAGRFHSGVSKILDFYNEDRFGQTASVQFNIDPQGLAGK